jgi:hypothetical protein
MERPHRWRAAGPSYFHCVMLDLEASNAFRAARARWNSNSDEIGDPLRIRSRLASMLGEVCISANAELNLPANQASILDAFV